MTAKNTTEEPLANQSLTRERIWRGLYEGTIQMIFYGRLASWLGATEGVLRFGTIGSAVLAGSTVAAPQMWGAYEQGVSQWAMLVTTFAGASLAAFNPGATAQRAEQTRERCAQVVDQLERLWQKCEDGHLQTEEAATEMGEIASRRHEATRGWSNNGVIVLTCIALWRAEEETKKRFETYRPTQENRQEE